MVATPVKLVAGLNETFLPLRMVATPLVGAMLVMVRGSFSGSESFARGLIVVAVFLWVKAMSLTATGAPLAGFAVTMMLTVAGALLVVPSLTRKVKASLPWKLRLGV